MKTFYVLLVSAQLGGLSFAANDPRSCCGSELLCKRRYNEVIYPATHNGHSYKKSDVANQDLSLTEQFEAGIRATKLHVWYDTDSTGKVVPFVCHGIDKKLLYDPPLNKALDHVPFLFRPFARACLEKAAPFKQIITDAFTYAYGTDNAGGAIPFKHCILDPASQPFKQALAEVEAFLATHPNEIMTLIIEDHTRNLKRLAADFKKAGLVSFAHTQKSDAPWPTLEQMIKRNKRLVVFLHGDQDLEYAKYPWMHYLWEYAWDTKSDFKDVNQFKDNCYDTVPNRGKQAFADRNKEPKNKIFVVHHFLTELIGGSKAHALKANRKHVLRNRLKRLQKETGHLPTIVQVDFFEHPANEFFSVINELNGI
ncbi:hypothetical protein JST99_04505 [Candidatus Dependentiae bacterium]|nr:hypothetical protein [Candidatus Dependentiae bacterium]